jgi:cytochrome c peroxidase
MIVRQIYSGGITMRATNRHLSFLSLCAVLLALLSGNGSLIIPAPVLAQAVEEAGDPPEIVIGERLFLETRFAQFFKQFVDRGGGTNRPLPAGDPVMSTTVTVGEPLLGPFAGQSMNCRACHLVDEHVETPGGSMRTYADFARRSPVPAREDGATTAPRNSPALVNATLPRTGGLLLHFDAEFATTADLIEDTFTGRNFGWLPGERALAIAHLARVVREDNGGGGLAQDFGSLPYAVVLTGTDSSIPEEFRLPERFRVNAATASDADIVHAVSKLVSAYTEGLVFSQDETGAFNLSPYDVFLEKNSLPRKPAARETSLEYSRRLLKLIERLERDGSLSLVTHNPHKKHRQHHRHLKFVKQNPATEDGTFQFHDQPFKFGREELQGLKIFFTEPSHGPSLSESLKRGNVGNCIACHQAPIFTDFRFHNTGTTQTEYDRIHGSGTFASLPIPALRERNANHNQYLPATEEHPHARGPFRAVPAAGNPNLTDLGVWNVFANADFPASQRRIRRILCVELLSVSLPGLSISSSQGDDTLDRLAESGAFAGRCSEHALLPASVAVFKTPGLRDLGHSAPYMHTGQFDTLEQIVTFYQVSSDLERADRLRNGDRELSGIRLTDQDVSPLTAFLKALNEDYE